MIYEAETVKYSAFSRKKTARQISGRPLLRYSGRTADWGRPGASAGGAPAVPARGRAAEGGAIMGVATDGSNMGGFAGLADRAGPDRGYRGWKGTRLNSRH